MNFNMTWHACQKGKTFFRSSCRCVCFAPLAHCTYCFCYCGVYIKIDSNHSLTYYKSIEQHVKTERVGEKLQLFCCCLTVVSYEYWFCTERKPDKHTKSAWWRKHNPHTTHIHTFFAWRAINDIESAMLKKRYKRKLKLPKSEEENCSGFFFYPASLFFANLILEKKKQWFRLAYTFPRLVLSFLCG